MPAPSSLGFLIPALKQKTLQFEGLHGSFAFGEITKVVLTLRILAEVDADIIQIFNRVSKLVAQNHQLRVSDDRD